MPTKFIPHVLFLLLAPVLCLTSLSQARSLNTIDQDFKPLAGYVVDTIQGRVLLDLNASSGLVPGDLVSICTQGKAIIHPVSKKVLGHAQTLQSLLQVIQVDKGFSTTRPLSGASAVHRGQKVKRFGQMQAVFWDEATQDEALYQRLRQAIPHLTWIGFHQGLAMQPDPAQPLADKPRDHLYFIKKDQKLQVRGPFFDLIHTYVLGQEEGAPVSSPRKDLSKGHAVSYQEQFSNLRTLESRGTPMIMADFLERPQGQLMASTDGQRIRVTRVGKEVREVATAQTDYPGRILSLSWWTPSGRDKAVVSGQDAKRSL